MAVEREFNRALCAGVPARGQPGGGQRSTDFVAGTEQPHHAGFGEYVIEPGDLREYVAAESES